jgi:Sulfotransferase family
MTRHIDTAALINDTAALNGLTYHNLSFAEPLEHFVDSVENEAHLSDAGIEGFRQDLTRLLTNRLGIDAAVAANPEILDEDVSDPLIITGLPRTGTTKLQKVLATGPTYQMLPLWQALFPAPIAPPGTDPDPRITITDEQAAIMFDNFPDFMAAHPMRTHEPEEEVLLLQLSFRTPANSWFYRSPSYLEWVEKQDQTPAYDDLRRTLQFLQWQDGGRRDRPWVLKSPIHLGALDLVFATFPRATVVHCHRDLHDAVPSHIRLIEAILGSRGAQSVDLAELGQFLAGYDAELWNRNLAQRHGRAKSQIVDVRYEDIRDDVASVVDLIHTRRGLTLDPDTRSLMLAWQDENPQHRFGKHVYSMQRYGLTAEQLDRQFARYNAQFLQRSNAAAQQ